MTHVLHCTVILLSTAVTALTQAEKDLNKAADEAATETKKAVGEEKTEAAAAEPPKTEEPAATEPPKQEEVCQWSECTFLSCLLS